MSRFPQTVEKLWEITVHATTDKIMNAWDQIKQRLEDKTQSGGFPQLGGSNRHFESADGDSIVVTAPDEATRSFMEVDYRRRGSGVRFGNSETALTREFILRD